MLPQAKLMILWVAGNRIVGMVKEEEIQADGFVEVEEPFVFAEQQVQPKKVATALLPLSQVVPVDKIRTRVDSYADASGAAFTQLRMAYEQAVQNVAAARAGLVLASGPLKSVP